MPSLDTVHTGHRLDAAWVGLKSPSGEVHVGAMNEWPGPGWALGRSAFEAHRAPPGKHGERHVTGRGI